MPTARGLYRANPDGTLDAFPRALGLFARTGFAAAVEPDRSAMRPMPNPD
ncbi:MAG: hypothetical protein QF654_07875 [Alphaproteobacteria bacterium]|jgi:hypothetical protein|nr:hypothetical protein [Alphaproteobacteria bacterium]|tara:strand:- start:189 stop:338 length:150 start_codon:yes stop_codon:yes gene_type:complete